MGEGIMPISNTPIRQVRWWLLLLTTLGHFHSVRAEVILDHATVTALVNDYGHQDVVLSILTPDVATYSCAGGNNNTNDAVWIFSASMLETGSGTPIQTNLEKVYALLNVAWLTGMTIQIEGDSLTCVTSHITLHNPL